jgi:hypothetical protein
MRIYTNLFNKLITPENLFFAWEEFRRDKKKKEDVLLFEKNLEREIFYLHRESQVSLHIVIVGMQGFIFQIPNVAIYTRHRLEIECFTMQL